MRPLTLHVLESALSQLAAWRSDGLDLHVAVNLAVHNLLDLRTPGQVADSAQVGYQDGRVDRPVHRIQPVRVTHRAPDGSVSEGHGSLTFIAELPLEELAGRR